MLHIATVHWKDDRWIDIQLAYIGRNIAAPTRVYAFVNRIPTDHSHKFFYSSTEEILSHPIKLNILADLICMSAPSPHDVIVFMDGDAFPIAPLDDRLTSLLGEYDLIAVRRDENSGDRQPHPCFCATTVGFWHKIRGDWKSGHGWTNADGEWRTDVGGNLLGILENVGARWYPLQRSNAVNLHPLFFGVYDDLVYHHGGAFRKSLGGRVSRVNSGEWALKHSRRARILDSLPDVAVARQIKTRYHPATQLQADLFRRTAELSETVFARIAADPDFYREFLVPSPQPAQ